jgi:hypothetical protein
MLIGVTLVAIPCACIAWQAKIVHARHEAFNMLEARGGLWKSTANLMFPGPVQSWFNQILGDIPPQKYIFLGDDQHFTEAEIFRLKQLFPEAGAKKGQSKKGSERFRNSF